jgi:KUP system potassium uptake protein
MKNPAGAPNQKPSLLFDQGLYCRDAMANAVDLETDIEAAARDHTGRPAASRRAKGQWLMPAMTAAGVVYGDIGTSPLYAFQVALGATGHAAPTSTDVLGVVSLIFWAVILVVAVKYVTVVMRADNEGEGGILALLSLVAAEKQLQRRGVSILVMLGIIGAAFIYGDGIITPAISVLSALEGVDVAAPALNDWILPLTLAVLAGLFAVQSRGTGQIGRVFGPVMIIWFLVIAVLGGVAIARTPAILAAADPRHALNLLRHGGKNVLPIIGAAFLALTGAEALYADMGHVGATAIRRAWFGLVLPALLLSYFGQGALVLAHPGAADNPFYNLAPRWAVLPLVALAAMATVIASQALISGAFSLTRQAMQMRLLPRMQVRSTSSMHHGQIYLGAINWSLMVGSIVVVLGFKTSSNLAAAYGIAVSGTMLITSILLFNVVRARWRWSLPAASLLIGLFAVIDLVFLDANATKFLEGGWFPLAVGASLATIMLVWRSGALEVQHRLEEMTVPFDRFTESLEEQLVARIPGCAVVFTRALHNASPILIQQVRHNKVLHEHVILMTIEPVARPVVHARERLAVTHLGHGFHRVVVKLGFMQSPDLPAYVKGCARLGLDCVNQEIHYLVAYEHVARRARNAHFPMALWQLFSLLSKMGVRLTDFLHIPEDQVFEVGIKVAI